MLREFKEFDIQGIFELYSDPEVHKYLGNKPIKTIKEAEQTIDYIRNKYEKDGIGRWAIIDNKTEDFIGWSGLKYEDVVREEFDYYDIGYRLRKKYWGKGIATESAIVSMKYGFEKLNLEEISGGADIENMASNKILKNIGLDFKYTFDYDDTPHNWYSIRKSEWLKKSIEVPSGTVLID